MKKKYNLDQINHILYGNTVIKNLWAAEKQEASQIFLEHSDERPNMFNIPSLWAPIVKGLMRELVGIAPGICFYQVKEKFGELRVYAKPPEEYRDVVRQMIHAASKAINTVTLAQLRITDRWYGQEQ